MSIPPWAVPVATVYFNPAAPEDGEFVAQISPIAVHWLSELTDFELTIAALEASFVIRDRLLLPPTPADVSGLPVSPLETLKGKVEEWAASLPEHPKWESLRSEMLTFVRESV